MKQTQWMLYTRRADFQSLAAEYGISPILARILVNRGTAPEEFRMYLHGSREDLHDPFLMRDMEPAVRLVLEAAAQHRRIRVVGDYDVDGICSTYLLVRMLQRLGAEASYDIPDRIRDGYGINEAIIRRAAEDRVDLVLTCDNGIAAKSALTLAQELGIRVIVTDHHEIPMTETGEEDLPPAEAVVDPHREGCPYPWKAVCGGMIALKFMQAAFRLAGLPETEWQRHLEFAALATVADVMPLKDENRIIVREGLREMASEENLGLRTLISVCGLDPAGLTAYSIGFVLGPCLNAAGRLETARNALELFFCEDPKQAEKLALHLKQLNDERKDMTQKYADEAAALTDREFPDDPVKVLYLPGCHESLAGIIAGRVREYCNHPAIVFTDSEDGLLKGSARSIEAYNMFEKLSEQKSLLMKFGGHPMAAGMTIRREDLEPLRARLNEASGLTDSDFVEKIWIDVALPFRYADLGLAEELSRLEPFGQGNERPLFAQKNVQIRGIRVMGRLHNVVRLELKGEDGVPAVGILFTDGDAWVREYGSVKAMDLLYCPQVNEYQGRRSVQMMVRGCKPSAAG